MEPVSINKLALLTTNELINELLTRFDTACFCGLRDEGKRLNREGSFMEVIRYKGNFHHALGLFSRASFKVNKNFEQGCRETDDL